MSRNELKFWNDEMPQQLATTLALIADQSTMRDFLSDVMTEKEILEISARLEAAKMLTNGESYIAITSRTSLSSRTVARISDWLKNGTKGYERALQSGNLIHEHTPPVSAE